MDRREKRNPERSVLVPDNSGVYTLYKTPDNCYISAGYRHVLRWSDVEAHDCDAAFRAFSLGYLAAEAHRDHSVSPFDYRETSSVSPFGGSLGHHDHGPAARRRGFVARA